MGGLERTSATHRDSGGVWSLTLLIDSASELIFSVKSPPLVSDQHRERAMKMRSKLSIPALVVAATLGAMDIASAQTDTVNQPPVESAAAAKAKAAQREKTTLRPSTTTGMSRGTPGARINHYKQPGN
jgi:hypothetical protein